MSKKAVYKHIKSPETTLINKINYGKLTT